MKTIGFVVSGKENERRRALHPMHLGRVSHPNALVFEEGYGDVLGFSDDVFRSAGCRIASRSEVFKCDIVCNPKSPEPTEMQLFGNGQTYFGWVHAVQGRATTDFLIERQMTAIAWEDMYEAGRHSFWRNNEIAGEAAIFHAINYMGRLPSGLSAAIIGRGNCAMGAINALSKLGVNIRVYDRRTVALLPQEIEKYDIIVNAVMWDVFQSGHMIHRADLSKMRRGSMIIDISCDEAMGIETSHPTPIFDPVYEIDGIIHYVVDHTPAIYFRSATEAISEVVSRFIDQITLGTHSECLEQATVIRDGRIVDPRITLFQQR